MSYVPITPTFYEMFQPDSPFHAGSSGWTQAPWPGWGNNPVQRGPRMLATNGLGCGCGVGQEQPSPSKLPLYIGLGLAAVLGTIVVMRMRKGYKPNRRRRYRRNSWGNDALGHSRAATLGWRRRRVGRPTKRKRGRRYQRNAVWSTAYTNRLPDSAFLMVDKQCVTYKEGGQSHPLSCRKFPYKNHRGQIDLPHLRNAIARAPQANISDTKVRQVQSKARRLLARSQTAA